MSDQPDSMDTRARDARVSRFGKMMRRMMLFSLLVGAAAAAVVVQGDQSPSIHKIIATAILAGGSVMMAGFLMSLVFMSNSSGHDADVASAAEDMKDERK